MLVNELSENGSAPFQVKGALNRLAESNLHVIARQIEDMYMSNSRNLMKECLCQILTASKYRDQFAFDISVQLLAFRAPSEGFTNQFRPLEDPHLFQ